MTDEKWMLGEFAELARRYRDGDVCVQSYGEGEWPNEICGMVEAFLCHLHWRDSTQKPRDGQRCWAITEYIYDKGRRKERLTWVSGRWHFTGEDEETGGPVDIDRLRVLAWCLEFVPPDPEAL